MRPEVLKKYGNLLAFRASLAFELNRDISLYYDTLYRSIQSVREHVAEALSAAEQLLGHATGDVMQTATVVPEPEGPSLQDIQKALQERSQVGEAKTFLRDKVLSNVQDWLLWGVYYDPEFRLEKFPKSSATVLLRYAQDLHRDEFAGTLSGLLDAKPVFRPWEPRASFTLTPAFVEYGPTLYGVSGPFDGAGGDIEISLDDEVVTWSIPSATPATTMLCDGTQDFAEASAAMLEFSPVGAKFNTYVRTALSIQVIPGGIITGAPGDFSDLFPGDVLEIGGSPYVLDLILSSSMVHSENHPPAGVYINVDVHHSPVLSIRATCPEAGTNDVLYAPMIALGVDRTALQLQEAFEAVDDPGDPVFSYHVACGETLQVSISHPGAGTRLALLGPGTFDCGAYAWSSSTPGASSTGTDAFGSLGITVRKADGTLDSAATTFSSTMTPAQIVEFLNDPLGVFSALVVAEEESGGVRITGLYPGTAGRLTASSDFGYSGILHGVPASLVSTGSLSISREDSVSSEFLPAVTTAGGLTCSVPVGVDATWVAAVRFSGSKAEEFYRISDVGAGSLTTHVPVDSPGVPVQVRFSRSILRVSPVDTTVIEITADTSDPAGELGISGESAAGTTSKFLYTEEVHELDVLVGAPGNPHAVILSPELVISAQLPANQTYSVAAWPPGSQEKSIYTALRSMLPSGAAELTKDQLKTFTEECSAFLETVDSLSRPPETEIYESLLAYVRGENLVTSSVAMSYGGLGVAMSATEITA